MCRIQSVFVIANLSFHLLSVYSDYQLRTNV